MPNQLKMPKIQSILALRQQGWPFIRIAEELGIHRETVARYVRLHSKPAEAPTGSAEPKPTEAALPARTIQNQQSAPAGSTARMHRSQRLRAACGGHRAEARSGAACQADLPGPGGGARFSGSYWSVMRFVRGLRRTHELPFRRMEASPAKRPRSISAAGIRSSTPEGRRRKTHVFRIVLSHSRKGYSEAVFRQTTENFIRCLENAFQHFGGSVKTLVIDNLRAAVHQGGLVRARTASAAAIVLRTLWRGGLAHPVRTCRVTRARSNRG